MADIRTRASRYSNPRLGAAFENLADAFGPPAAADIYAYARAGAEKEKAARLADVYSRATAPGASIEGLDLPSIAAGLYSPNASGWAVRTRDNTDRRGQDITSSDNRRGHDVQATTSRANNADTNRTSTTNTLLTPIQKDAIRHIPQSVAELYGLPTQQRGVIAAQPGERNVLPNNEVIDGAPKPKTRTEVEADVLLEMTPDERNAIVFGNTPVVETGKGPMTRPNQLKTSTPELGDKNPQVFNSKSGPVRWDALKQAYVSVSTGQPVDVSGGLQAPSAAQGKDGTLGPTMANQTAGNAKEAGLNVMDATLNEYETLLKNNPAIVGIPGNIRGAAQNAVSAAQEFGAAFGNVAPEAKITADQVAAVAGKITSGRDPAIAKARIMQADLAYKWAQMQNPTGEVSRQAFERAIEAMSGGTLANNQSALEAITAVREAVKRERSGVATLRNPGGPAPAAGGAPASAGGAPAAAPRQRYVNPQTKEVIEWDGAQWVPVK